MSYLDDAELYAFAKEPAAPNVTPVYPQYQRPSMNTAPIIDTANRFAQQQENIAASQQERDIRGKEAPLRLQSLQDAHTEALNRLSESDRWDKLNTTLAFNDAAQYVVGLPKEQQQAAWAAAGQQFEQYGIGSPDQRAAWGKVGPDQYQTYAEGLKATAGWAQNYMTARGGRGTGGAYSASAEGQIRLQAERETQKWADAQGDTPPTDQERTDHFNQIYKEMRDAGQASAAPTTPAPPRDTRTWWQQTMPDWLGGKEPPAPQPPANPGATAAEAAKSAGSIQEDAGKAGGKSRDFNAKADTSNFTGGAGAGPGDAIGYGGDPKDEDAQSRWFAAIRPGQWFVNPKDGKPLQKRANETVEEAEGG